jgi:signal transduction histidine kinase/DNA-binding response OmpR family regulator/ligand-binding sensor domain-containing protein
VARIQHVSVDQGLRNRFVLNILFDQRGYAWLGTYNGAHRYDGYGFDVFDRPDHGLQSNSISAMREDGDGTLWLFENELGLARYVDVLPPGSSKTQSYAAWAGRPLPFAPDQVLTSHLLNWNGSVFLPTNAGDLWLARGRSLRRMHRPPGSGTVVSALVTPTRTLAVVAGNNSLNRYEVIVFEPDGRVRWRHPLPGPMHLAGADPTGTLWLYRHGQHPTPAGRTVWHPAEFLLRLDDARRATWVPMPLGQEVFRTAAAQRLVLNYFQARYDPRRGVFWCASLSDGLGNVFAWHPRHGVVFDLAAEGFPVSKLQNLHDVELDADGNAWVGTSDGLLILSLEPNRFSRYLYAPDRAETAHLSVRGLVPVGDWLWANSQGSPYWINLKTGEAQAPRTCHPGFLYGAIRGREGEVWAVSAGAYRLSADRQRCDRYELAMTRNGNYAWALWQEPDGRFLLGHELGLSRFNPRTGTNSAFAGYGPFDRLVRSRVNAFLPDSTRGGTWVAASTGLYWLDAHRGITARYATDEPGHRLPFDHVLHLHADRQTPGVYWLATLGGGLIRWEPATGRARQFTTRDGLPHDVVYCVYEDALHRLWLSSDYGIACFDKRTGLTQVYLPKDGITHEEFNRTAHTQAPDGRLFFGGLNGITAFSPETIAPPRRTPPTLYLTRYQQLDGRTGALLDETERLRRQGRITLDPNSRLFTLAFTLFDYHDARRCRYAYRIAGWQEEWVAMTDNTLRINGLPAGDYRLQVRGQTSDGRWAATPLAVAIEVLRPVYQRGWFLALCAVVLLTLGWVTYRLRTRWLRRENERLETEVARRTAQIERQADELRRADTLKTRFFANVSHEFRTPLTLLLGPVRHLLKRTDDPQGTNLLRSMERNAEHLLGLVSDLLDLTKAEASGLQLAETPADFAGVVARTVAAFESGAGYAGVGLALHQPSERPTLYVDAPKLQTVLKNLLANALRFTPPGGTVDVFLAFGETEARVEVRDTGRGIHPDDLPRIFDRYFQSGRADGALHGGTGIGLALARECCAAWGGTLTVESTPGAGSRFTLTYPRRPAPLADVVFCPTPAAEPTVAEGPPTDGDRVLLVEDNPDMSRYLHTILAPHYRLQGCRDGQEAWEWLRTRSDADLPRLVVSDMMMPRMDGMTLLRNLKTDDRLRDLPFVMLTARTALEDKLDALRTGVADYLTKPFDEDELLARVHNLLERARERDAWRAQAADEAAPHPPTAGEAWLLELEALVRSQLTDSRLQVGYLADALNLSERQLYRRVKESTGLSPNQYIQEIRLQTARTWLEAGRFSSVKEVSHAVGFGQTEYFSRLFQQRFGKNPSELQSRLKGKQTGAV